MPLRRYHSVPVNWWYCLLLWLWWGTRTSYSSSQKVRVVYTRASMTGCKRGPKHVVYYSLPVHAQFQKWLWKLVRPKPDQPDHLLWPWCHKCWMPNHWCTFLDIFIFFMHPLNASSSVRMRSFSTGGSCFGCEWPFSPPNATWPSVNNILIVEEICRMVMVWQMI